MSGNCQFTYINNCRKLRRDKMIILGIYMIISVLVPYLLALLLDIIPSVGVLVVIIIGLVMMFSAAAGRNLSRGFSTGLINGILQGFWYCVTLLINTMKKKWILINKTLNLHKLWTLSSVPKVHLKFIPSIEYKKLN